ncbi:hypothetical protein BN903_20 [Halorubrum sp. AJ67]|nr:hypothetical protein BN903_20 [Halorubrum sp. AJ67]
MLKPSVVDICTVSIAQYRETMHRIVALIIELGFSTKDPIVILQSISQL